MSPHPQPVARPPRVIAVTSGKGGVGKTMFSVHLAARAARRGQRVLLMDADLGLANVDVMLGVSPAASIQQVVEDECSLQDVLVRCEEGGGFDVIPGGSGLHGLTRLSSAQQRILLDEMDALGPRYDLVLIDTAAGIGDNVMYFVSASESAVVVLTPDPTSLTDAYALIKVLSRQRDMRRFMVVVNQAAELDAQITFRRLLSVADRYLDVHLEYMGHVPESGNVRRAIQSQRLMTPGSTMPAELENALDAVLDHPRDGARGGLRFFWQHALSDAMANDDEPRRASA